MEKPQKLDNYDVHKIEDIDVYVKKDIVVRKNELHVFLRKFLWIKELAVDGMVINI